MSSFTNGIVIIDDVDSDVSVSDLYLSEILNIYLKTTTIYTVDDDNYNYFGFILFN